MKLNYRDKIVLTIAIVALVWVAGIMFFIKPGIEDYKSAQAELDDAKAKLATLEQRIKEDEDLDDRIQVAYNEANELTSTFYEYQKTQEATQKIDDLLSDEELVNSNMSIMSYSSYPLKKYVYIDDTVVTDLDTTVFDYENTKEGEYIPDELATNDVEESAASDPLAESSASQTNIGRYSLTFSFKGTLGSLKEFCRKLEAVNKEKTIVIESLTFQYPKKVEEIEEEEEEEVTTVDPETGEEVKTKVKKTEDKDKDKEEEEEDPNEKEVEGEITLNMIVVRKLPDPSKF